MALPSHKPSHHFSKALRVALRGQSLLTSPRFNKGTAFSESERKAFGLVARLPYRVNTLDEQCERAYYQLNTRETPLAKNVFLQSLKAQNWTLYYALLARHLKELVPIIYTPTEVSCFLDLYPRPYIKHLIIQADAIANYSHLFRRSEGLYLSYQNRDSMEEDFLEQTRGRDIDLVVCTDSEAILGIGDQGVGVRIYLATRSEGWKVTHLLNRAFGYLFCAAHVRFSNLNSVYRLLQPNRLYILWSED